MNGAMLFIKNNKDLIAGLIVVAIAITCLWFYGHAERKNAMLVVANEVNTKSVKTLTKVAKDNESAVTTSQKQEEKRINDSQQFDKNQSKREVDISKKYRMTIKVPTTSSSPHGMVAETLSLPATVPNAEEAEISSVRIADSWERFCHFKQQDGLPCTN